MEYICLVTHDRLKELALVTPVARWNIGNTNGFVIVVEQDAVNASVAAQVEIVLYIHDAMDVGCGVQLSMRETRPLLKRAYR